MKHSTATLGALCSAIAFMFFTSFDTLTKVLSQSCSVFLVMTVSCGSAALIMMGYVRAKYKDQHPAIFKMHRPKLHLARGIGQIIGQSCLYLAIPHTSLAEFYVVIFTMPLMTILISTLTLKEPIKPFVWLMVALNFIGILIALRPDQGLSVWTLVLFFGTFVLACSLVLLSKMMQTESSEMTSITTTLALALGAVVPAVVMFEGLSMDVLGWMLIGGVLCACSQILLSTAYKLAPPAYASPPQFLQLIYGAIAGYLVFGEVPSIWIYIGGGIVILANVTLILNQPRSMRGQNG